MALGRALCEGLFQDLVAACDPAKLVWRALARSHRLGGWPTVEGEVYGIAIGKAALAMARGAGPVKRGVCVTNADDNLEVPNGWTVLVSGHPEPDERSLAAGDAVIDVVASTPPNARILALVSGGASSLVERLEPGVTLATLRAETRALIAAGAPIHELNKARSARSALKGGKLAQMAGAPITTLVVSDVFDDDLATIGSGPTVPPRPQDRIELVAPMRLAAEEMYALLAHRRRILVTAPLVGLVGDVATKLESYVSEVERDHGICVAWGEATVELPRDHGVGGRAQHLALLIARMIANTEISAFVVGTDGVDGQMPIGRDMPAGAYVDGRTWQAISDADINPNTALERCDSGTALDAVGALVVTGPTGINHGDLVLVG
jgi:hydroxypyruvate reductase